MYKVSSAVTHSSLMHVHVYIFINYVCFTFFKGEFGSVDTSKKREADIVKQKLQSQAVSFM